MSTLVADIFETITSPIHEILEHLLSKQTAKSVMCVADNRHISLVFVAVPLVTSA